MEQKIVTLLAFLFVPSILGAPFFDFQEFEKHVDNAVYWEIGGWGECTDGKMSRDVHCINDYGGREYKITVAECEKILSEKIPAKTKDCGQPQPIEPNEIDLYWYTEPWKECKDGQQQRVVRCYGKNKNGGEDYQLNMDVCRDKIGAGEPTKEKYCGNMNGPQPIEPAKSDLYWKTEEWEECNNGKKWRPVRCYDAIKEVLYEDCEDEIGVAPSQWGDC